MAVIDRPPTRKTHLPPPIIFESYNTLVQDSGYTPRVKKGATWREQGWRDSHPVYGSRLNKLIEVMTQSSPDIIQLQEIRHCDTLPRAPRYNDFEEILKKQGYTGHFLKRPYEEEGVAIFYKKHRFEVISTSSLVFKASGRVTLLVRLRSKENQVFNFTTTHLHYCKEQNEMEMEELAAFLSHHKGTSIAGGDLNLRPDSPSLNLLKTAGMRDPHLECPKGTFKDHPDKINRPGAVYSPEPYRLDYLLTSPDIVVRKADVVGDPKELLHPSTPSDHAPLIITAHLPVNRPTLKVEFDFLITKIQNGNLKGALQQFDDFIPRDLKHAVYGRTYHIARERGIPHGLHDFGRYAFHGTEGCDDERLHEVRIQALREVQTQFLT